MLKFFTLDEYNNLVIDKPEIVLHPEFATIYRKSLPVEGDADGKKKVYARRVFTYIYLMYDYGSPFTTEKEDKRHKLSTKEARLEEQWKPNKQEKEAIDKYLFLQDIATPTLKILASIKRGLSVSAEIVNKQVDRIYKNLEMVENLSNTLDYTKSEDVTAYNTLTDILQKNLTSFLPLSETINKTLIGLDGLEEKALKELNTGSRVAAGNKVIGNRADPK